MQYAGRANEALLPDFPCRRLPTAYCLLNMRCDTCHQESSVILRVVVAKGYNRALARPLFNCPRCYEHKEQQTLAAKDTGGKRGE